MEAFLKLLADEIQVVRIALAKALSSFVGKNSKRSQNGLTCVSESFLD
jgi:hypothetical protein